MKKDFQLARLSTIEFIALEEYIFIAHTIQFHILAQNLLYFLAQFQKLSHHQDISELHTHLCSKSYRFTTLLL